MPKRDRPLLNHPAGGHPPPDDELDTGIAGAERAVLGVQATASVEALRDAVQRLERLAEDLRAAIAKRESGWLS